MPEVRALLAEKIAGEITLSESPGATLKKWRKNFEISQTEMAQQLKVNTSVISDYESGRRKSPGTHLVSRIVNAMLDIDEKRGGKKIRAYETIVHESWIADVIYDMREYSTPISLIEFQKLIKAEFVTEVLDRQINGYTIIDSIKAILKLSATEFYRLYGWSTERALVFAGVSTGRSPLVAVRVTNLKPGVIVLQGLKGSDVDPVAKKIAEVEKLSLLATMMPVEEMIKVLR
jgi:putative transcriptional regulator